MKTIVFTFYPIYSFSLNVLAQEATGKELIYLNETRMNKVKEEIAQKNIYYKSAYQELIEEADKTLSYIIDPVINKTLTPPSGDKHDYLNIAPYFWLDSTKNDGLLWIANDGKVNLLSRGKSTDQTHTADLWKELQKLELAFFFSKDI